jgi:hypothetical protein
MPLTALSLLDCPQVADLTPLQKMNLTEIAFSPKYITTGLDMPQRMKTLKTISVNLTLEGRFTAQEFWKKYRAGEFNK